MNSVLLRELSDEDIPLFKKWLYAPHVATWFPDPLDWIDEVENRKGAFSFLHHFIVEEGNEPMGFSQFYEYRHGGEDWYENTDIDGTYSIDYLIGDTAYLGKGYGTAIVNALIEKIKMRRDAKRIVVKPALENKASCNTLLSCGFFFDTSNEIYVLDL